MKKPVTVTITGAAGNIGYALAFRVASGQMLGADQPINLNLLEIPAASAAVQGVVMELNDCAFPTLNKVTASSDAGVASRIVISPCWSARGRAAPAWSARICCWKTPRSFRPRARRWTRWPRRDVRVLVVGNPANTNSLIAQRNAPSLPRNRFTAMTRLDHNRGTGAAHREERSAPGGGQEGHHLGQPLGHPVSRPASCHRRRQAGALGGGSRPGSRTPLFRRCSSAAPPSSRRAAPPPPPPRRRRRSIMFTIGCSARRRAIGSAWPSPPTAATEYRKE